jgi:hypothetical protein
MKINEHYGIKMPIREDDIEAIYWVAKEREDWDSLKEIGAFSIALYPAFSDGYFMLSAVAEQNNSYTKALKLYEKRYLNLGDDVTNKKDFFRHIERLLKIIKTEQ